VYSEKVDAKLNMAQYQEGLATLTLLDPDGVTET